MPSSETLEKAEEVADSFCQVLTGLADAVRHRAPSHKLQDIARPHRQALGRRLNLRFNSAPGLNKVPIIQKTCFLLAHLLLSFVQFGSGIGEVQQVLSACGDLDYVGAAFSLIVVVIKRLEATEEVKEQAHKLVEAMRDLIKQCLQPMQDQLSEAADYFVAAISKGAILCQALHREGMRCEAFFI